MIFKTPFSAHCCNSLSLIFLEAFAISGVSIPNPEQNNFNPPPVPVDSTTGVGTLPFLPNSSATADEKGYTVDEPTILIWSLALKVVTNKALAINAIDVFLKVIIVSIFYLR